MAIYLDSRTSTIPATITDPSGPTSSRIAVIPSHCHGAPACIDPIKRPELTITPVIAAAEITDSSAQPTDNPAPARHSNLPCSTYLENSIGAPPFRRARTRTTFRVGRREFQRCWITRAAEVCRPRTAAVRCGTAG